MTAAVTFTALLVLAGVCVGYKTDRLGLVILNTIFLAALAIITFILFGPDNGSNTAVSTFWTFASIVVGFCIPMTLAYYVSGLMISATSSAPTSAPIRTAV